MDDHDQYTRDCHTSTLCLIIIEAEAEGVNQLQTERPSQSEAKIAISAFFGQFEPQKIDFSYKPMRMPTIAF